MNQIAKGEKIAIDPAGGPPEIEIKIGSSAIGFYSVYLIHGKDHPLVCKGQSDQPVKSCPIGNDASSLPGQKLSWQIGIAGTDPFSIFVTLSQDGRELKSYTYDGQGDQFLVDYVSLVSK